MAKKKLLIASDTFLPRWDGVSRFLAEVVPRLSADYEVKLVAPDFTPKGKVRIKDVEIVRIPIHKMMFGDYVPPKMKFRMMKKLVKEADIVFSQTIGPIGALAIIYGKRFKKPVYAYTHSIEWELVPRSIAKFKNMFYLLSLSFARYVYNKCNLIFIPSRDTEKVLEGNGIKPEKRITPLGVNSKQFSPPESKEEAKKKAGISPESTVIGYIGRIGREKDLPTLYKAFRLVQKEYPDLKLLIVGSGIRLENMFDDMTDIMHIESTNKANEYYQAIDVFVMPSLTETSSLSTMEAMSTGLPVIATDVGCVKEYIKNGKNGYIFQKEDYSGLANKISKLISNESLRKAIGMMARKTTMTRFSWQRTVDELEKVFG